MRIQPQLSFLRMCGLPQEQNVLQEGLFLFLKSLAMFFHETSKKARLEANLYTPPIEVMTEAPKSQAYEWKQETYIDLHSSMGFVTGGKMKTCF